MKRPEAAEILKELLLTCRALEGKSVKLMPPDADSVIADGFQIHVQKTVGDKENMCINRIAKKYSLKVHEDECFLVLYRSSVVV